MERQRNGSRIVLHTALSLCLLSNETENENNRVGIYGASVDVVVVFVFAASELANTRAPTAFIYVRIFAYTVDSIIFFAFFLFSLAVLLLDFLATHTLPPTHSVFISRALCKRTLCV